GVKLSESLAVDRLDCKDESTTWVSGDDIPAGDTVRCEYFKDLGAVEPRGTQTNTVSASGSFNGQTSSGSATATYEFTKPTQSYNDHVTVTDDLLGASWTARSGDDYRTFQQVGSLATHTGQKVARVP